MDQCDVIMTSCLCLRHAGRQRRTVGVQKEWGVEASRGGVLGLRVRPELLTRGVHPGLFLPVLDLNRQGSVLVNTPSRRPLPPLSAPPPPTPRPTHPSLHATDCVILQPHISRI